MVENKKPRMTNWYDPRQLVDTAKRTVISTTLGKYADPRTGTTDPKPGSFFDYSQHVVPNGYDFEIDPSGGKRPEIWIDYAADVGDGWNPTYAVAYYLAQSELELEGVARKLPRGEVLFFGGDGVYPTANTKAYEERLVSAYRAAFQAGIADGGSPAASELVSGPHIFALPGNHDWYDSLVSFRQLFCSHVFNDRKFAADDGGNGGWRTRQSRSYFTLKLPHNWWLLAVDMQLTHNIDVSQLRYFESIVETCMEPGDKIILCVPEPYWTKFIKYKGITDVYDEKERSIEKLHRYFTSRGVEVKAYIAGDLHHYRRFEDGAGVQKITAGGGGAFLHPTHDFKFAKKPVEAGPKQQETYKDFWLAGEYPDYSESKKQDWKNFGFILRNPTFGLMTAAIYFVLALLVHGEVLTRFSWYAALKATVNRAIAEPLVLVVIGLLFLGLIFFTDSNSKTYKRVAGFLHGLAHLIAAFFVGWLAYLLTNWLAAKWGIPVPTADLPISSTRYSLLWLATVLVVGGAGGYIFGSIIMGIYLFVSLRFFKRHSNEAFSAMKIEDYKNFLRLHIDSNGTLTIYPIKIDRVPKKWKEVGDHLQPENGSGPQLIEEPIVVR